MEWSRDIYNGVTLDHVASENEHGLQKSYTVTYDPQTTQIRPVLNYGPYVMGGDIMSDMVAQVEADGSKVVFAINGDAYDTSNGVSNGLMIKNGVLISTSYNNSAEAVGFKADGTVIYGHTSLNITATPEGGSPITVFHVNKERKLDTENVYLLTEQFAKTTSSTQPGVEVVLNVTTPGYQGLVIGGQITASVASVNQVEANVDKNTTPIGKGQIVLSANTGQQPLRRTKRPDGRPEGNGGRAEQQQRRGLEPGGSGAGHFPCADAERCGQRGRLLGRRRHLRSGCQSPHRAGRQSRRKRGVVPVRRPSGGLGAGHQLPEHCGLPEGPGLRHHLQL